MADDRDATVRVARRGAAMSALVGAGAVAYAFARHRRSADRQPDRWADVLPLSRTAVRFLELDDGTVLRVFERGAGPTVVLLHGWGQNIDAWTYVEELLPRHVHVLAIDLPGHGRSTPMPDGYTTTDVVRTVARTVAHLDLREAVVVGHSFGGIVAQQLAIDYDDIITKHVAGLILVSTTARGALTDARSRVLAKLLSSGPFIEAARADRIGLLVARVAYPSSVSGSCVRLTRDIARDNRPGDRASFDLSALDDLSSRLGAIDVPVRVVTGIKDPATPVRQAATLAELIPLGQLRLLPGTGHLLPMERPDVVCEEIVEMLTAQPTWRKS
jgi:3-oxoadipate enol-lactonase